MLHRIALKYLAAARHVDGSTNEPQNKDVATQAAPAGRGFRVRQYQRDIFAKHGAAFCSHAASSIFSAMCLKARRPLTLQLTARLTIVLFGAGCVLACPPLSATAGPSETLQTAIPATLKVWSGSEKKLFRLDDLHSNRRDLAAFAGKVVLVHFFATWCEPCVREMASLQRLATTTRGKPLAILAVDVAEVDLRVRAFFAKQPVDFTILLDRDRAVSKSWDVTALPTTFVLDAHLTPKFFIEGDLDWSHPDVLTAIEPLFSATGPQRKKTISNK